MGKQIKFDSVVICSTLNQMVNYVVIKQHNIKNVYNIRMKDNFGSFNYDEWDENLKEVINSYEINFPKECIKFGENEIINHNQIKNKLVKKFGGETAQGYKCKFKKEKILWNITGGQRHFVMAITDYVYNNRPEDVIVYFEGDKEKMYYYTKDNINEKDIYIENKYPMSISLALKLMGFKMEKESIENTSEYYKFLISNTKNNEMAYEKIEQEYNWYNDFYDLYKESKTLRKFFIISNRIKNFKSEDKKINKTILDIVEEQINSEYIKKQVINEVDKKKFSEVFGKERFNILRRSLEAYDKNKVFGYILERMTFYTIIKQLKKDNSLMEKVADIDLSVKVRDEYASSTKKTTDEFDILIVTKKGKVIMLECKSGGMTGDNAKSHNYSTYAIAGVYGKPVLISPLLKSEKGCKEEFEIEASLVGKEANSGKNYKFKDVYEYIRQANYSADRANLEIWYVDTIIKTIKELLEEEKK